MPLISVLLENKHRLVKSDEKSPAHAPNTKEMANGDTGSVKGDTRSTSSGYTPSTKEGKTKSMIIMSQPQPPDPTKRDSSVFEMIAGTKSKINL